MKSRMDETPARDFAECKQILFVSVIADKAPFTLMLHLNPAALMRRLDISVMVLRLHESYTL